MIARLSPTQIWIASFLLTTLMFLVGMWVGSWEDDSETPPPEVVRVPTASGDFDDVEVNLETDASTYRWLCDMHFNVDPEVTDTAECEYRDP